MLREAIFRHVQVIDPDHKKTVEQFSVFSSSKILIACSGGADSLGLALIAYAMNLDITVAYIEHELSIETQACSLLVKQLADDLDADFVTRNLSMSQVTSNIEETARELRYGALEDLATQMQCDVIFTAHHLDDLAETLVINMIRGAGSGAASLVRQRGRIVRPLLHWRKKMLEELVDACGYDYFSDPGNEKNKFVRNRVRHEVFPLLNDVSQRDVVPLIARMARTMKDDQDFLSAYAASLWPGDSPDTRLLSQLDPVLQRHALRQWVSGLAPSSDELDRILEVVHHKVPRTQISGNRTIWRRGAQLYQDVTLTPDK